MADDVNTVLDRIEADDATPDVAAPDPAVAEPAAPAAAPAEPAGDSWLDTLPPEAAKEIRDLRKESQNYRQRARTYDEAFDGYGDDERQLFIDLAKASASDDPQARSWAAEVYGQLAAGVASTDTQQPGGGFSGDEVPLTRAELMRALDERDQKAALSQNVAGIIDEAKGLGYDPDGPEYVMLLTVANKQTGGDIAAAHKILEQRDQERIDAYLAKKAAAADGSVTPTPPTGVAPANDRDVASLSDSERRKAVTEFLNAREGV